MQHSIQAEGGVIEQDLGVLDALAVARHGEMNLVGKSLDALEQGGGFIHVAGRILAHADLGHLVDQLSIEETLLAGFGLVGAEFEGLDSGKIEGFVIDAGGTHRQSSKTEKKSDGQRPLEPHEEPPLVAATPRYENIGRIFNPAQGERFHPVQTMYNITKVCTVRSGGLSGPLFKQLEPLPRLPFLVGILACGGVEEMMVINHRLRPLVQ